ncbi:MAG: FAD-dependent oxidoreductase, partial [Nitrososphaera sp.]|nr:FAD-dependent oxidoreductase [Nitrososphaera sp.]
MKVGIIGAGPAGLAAAYQLTKANCPVDVYEASASVGGLCKSIDWCGQIVDIGPHRFFSRHKTVNELWLEVVRSDYRMVKRLTRILYNGRLFKYPLEPIDTFKKVGAIEGARCICSYFYEQLIPRSDDGTFQSWVCSRFGNRLFTLFFKSYSEKLWGIPCNEIDSDFAAQRIKQFSMSVALLSAMIKSRRVKHRTLVEEFAYPIAGTGMVYQRMQKAIQERGNNLYLQAPIQRIIVKKGKAVGLELADGQCRHYDRIVSSMPLTQLLRSLSEPQSDIIRLSDRLR